MAAEKKNLTTQADTSEREETTTKARGRTLTLSLDIHRLLDREVVDSADVGEETTKYELAERAIRVFIAERRARRAVTPTESS